ncbi:teichuronic acid exporter [Dysgonomonas sp. PFB1-18]|uniref:lipopolysaccharide biosynthesis protein n=1 Tax=unclassified Dysgonomonas TaxID=2630389 RepID=UPI002475FE8F|nr:MULTISPECIES: lipopolysaccharide biosynthesis protein [unclassified Dysgonomonas]MDH6307776.1 teichuronic acid exporter [Dysgonomonas sp. PF1-14]MDH6337694.1 teichuronic acid exporter [Dysgonomonas sp. PF1-16]MDH6378918.1 teichuronic acid exporter [Dysgonomonas sp. PFB1-18]MDH6396553.1 teichuronic acid exporter [Dysgonomonas sp. PF1-23]
MSLKEKAISGVSWLFIQKVATQGVSFLTTIVLARIILPEDFGLIGMIYVFIGIGNVLLDAGFSASLIRSQFVDQADLSTVFYFNIIASVGVYLLSYALAPFIASFLGHDILIIIIRVYSISFIFTAFTAIQNVMLIKEMRFKTQFYISLPSSILSGIVGIVFALLGYGVWALVWSGVAKSFFYSVQLWIHNKWRPSLVFDKKKFKYHFNFGSKLAINEIFNVIFVNLYPFFIGKFYTPTQVAYYTQSETLKQVPVANIYGSINVISFPLFSSIQEDLLRLREAYKKNIIYSYFILTPILIFMLVLAKSILIFLYTDKWVDATPYLQILCIIGIISPLKNTSLNILKTKGHGSLFLKLETFNKIITIISIFLSINFGIIIFLWAKVICEIISLLFNSYYAGRILNYSLLKQIQDIIPILAISCITGILIYILHNIISFYKIQHFVNILICGIISFSIYASLSFFFKKNLFIEIRDIILKKIAKT